MGASFRSSNHCGEEGPPAAPNLEGRPRRPAWSDGSRLGKVALGEVRNLTPVSRWAWSPQLIDLSFTQTHFLGDGVGQICWFAEYAAH